LKAGAKGYISKNSAAETLAKAIQAVYEGQHYVEPELVSETIPELDDNYRGNRQSREMVDSLSPREFDVFCLLAKGLTTHEIAIELHLGYKTVANYNTTIKTKLKVNTAAELANIAMALGILKY